MPLTRNTAKFYPDHIASFYKHLENRIIMCVCVCRHTQLLLPGLVQICIFFFVKHVSILAFAGFYSCHYFPSTQCDNRSHFIRYNKLSRCDLRMQEDVCRQYTNTMAFSVGMDFGLHAGFKAEGNWAYFQGVNAHLHHSLATLVETAPYVTEPKGERRLCFFVQALNSWNEMFLSLSFAPCKTSVASTGFASVKQE